MSWSLQALIFSLFVATPQFKYLLHWHTQDSGDQFLALPWAQALRYADWHAVKTQSHPTASDLSHHLIQSFRSFASGDILWPLLVRVKPHRVTACVTFGSFFKPKENLSMDWTGFYRPWCSCLAYSQLQRAAKTFHIAAGVMWREKAILRQKGFRIKAFLNLLQESKNTKQPFYWTLQASVSL